MLYVYILLYKLIALQNLKLRHLGHPNQASRGCRMFVEHLHGGLQHVSDRTSTRWITTC